MIHARKIFVAAFSFCFLSFFSCSENPVSSVENQDIISPPGVMPDEVNVPVLAKKKAVKNASALYNKTAVKSAVLRVPINKTAVKNASAPINKKFIRKFFNPKKGDIKVSKTAEIKIRK